MLVSAFLAVIGLLVLIFYQSAAQDKDEYLLSNEDLTHTCSEKVNFSTFEVCCNFADSSFVLVKRQQNTSFSIFLDECDIPIIYSALCEDTCFSLIYSGTYVCCKHNKTTIHQYYAKDRKWTVNLSLSDVNDLHTFKGCNMKKMRLVPADVQVKLLQNKLISKLPTSENYGYESLKRSYRETKAENVDEHSLSNVEAKHSLKETKEQGIQKNDIKETKEEGIQKDDVKESKEQGIQTDDESKLYKSKIHKALGERYLKLVDRIILQLRSYNFSWNTDFEFKDPPDLSVLETIEHVAGRMLRSSDPRIKNIELTVFSTAIYESTGSYPSPSEHTVRKTATYQAHSLKSQADRSKEKNLNLFDKKTLFRPFKEK